MRGDTYRTLRGEGYPRDTAQSAGIENGVTAFGADMVTAAALHGLLRPADAQIAGMNDDLKIDGKLPKWYTEEGFGEWGSEGTGRGKNINSADDFFQNPKAFGDATPAEWYQYFEDNGYNPQSLGSKSSLNGIPFDEGGGFRINWGGDRYVQYHPAIASHHGGAYWKISSGSLGTWRFDLNGNLLP